ncbi:MAG: mannose-1-phosphate guanylyltransferase/mannose-6-phosphate isomerase [Porticoccaceae bacterium]
MLIPVIMAGGSGTRLWPMSRKYLPKQFLRLTSDNTMLQETLLRLKGLDIARPIIVAGDDHRFLVAEQLRELGIEADILLEPEGKNTAPAIALAANWALKRGQTPQQAGSDPKFKSTEADETDETGGQSKIYSDPTINLLVLAADHVIQNVTAFQQAVQQAAQIASEGMLVTFGIVPTEPHTGYGYIQYSRGQSPDSDPNFHKVEAFVEKPDAATAQQYLDSGNYLWNSGMFLFGAQNYLDELNTHAPNIAGPCAKSVQGAQTDLDFIRVDTDAFKQSAEDSVDYAVMEKTQNAAVIPLDAGWSDVGSWTSLWDIASKDANGNHAASCQAILEDTHNCMIMGEPTSSGGESGRIITTLGVQDLVIIDTKDALLVANKHSIQDVKKIVSAVKKADGKHDEFHRVVYRPWGHYDSIDNGERHQVKRITVKPGEKLSVQMHHHRAEHWVVVAGTAKVTRDEETLTLSENESVYLPIGCVHALENPGKIALELIEVQSGSYLGEDDIVRIEDRYGRTKN